MRTANDREVQLSLVWAHDLFEQIVEMIFIRFIYIYVVWLKVSSQKLKKKKKASAESEPNAGRSR